MRTTVYPSGSVVSNGTDYQEISSLCGLYSELRVKILAHADRDTLFEIAETHRGPMRQVSREIWEAWKD